MTGVYNALCGYILYIVYYILMLFVLLGSNVWVLPCLLHFAYRYLDRFFFQLKCAYMYIILFECFNVEHR